MKIRSIAHRGLRRLVEQGDASGLMPATVEKVRNIVLFLQVMLNSEELRALTRWRVHQLTGKRKGTWSIRVTANWRITFEIDPVKNEIVALDLENYH